MSCCTEEICVSGRTYSANFIKRPDGSIVSGSYVDENFQIQNVNAGGFTFGACVASQTPSNTVYNDYICENGFTRSYKRVEDNNGTVLSQQYLNSLGAWVTLPAALPATIKMGQCPYQKHVASLAGITLVSPTTTIPHNLNLSNTKVGYVAYDVANNNQDITFDVGAFATNSFQLQNIAPAMAGLVIDIIVTGEG